MKTNFKSFLTLLLALLVQVAFAQEKTVTGVVSDASGPLPGVTVLVKNTAKGTQTDFNGKYTIKVKEGDIIYFSYIGMEPVYKKVGAQNVINVKMKEDAQALGEVVVTGVAGATSRKKLSITVDKVGEENLKKATSSSAASALQGKVAGISITTPQGTPGGTSNIQLRGATNLSGSQDPLILVDGVMIEGRLSDINVDDIASYEILKGAAASSYYGSRAGNGVIVITTKRGKSLNTGESVISIRSEVTSTEASNIMETSSHHAKKLASDYASHKTYTKYDGVTYPDGYKGGYDHTTKGNPAIKDNQYMDNPYGAYYNPVKQVLRKGISTTNYVSLSNRGEKTNVFTSFETHKNTGILKEIKGYDRQSFRANIDHKVKDWLKVSASNAYIHTDNQAPNGIGRGTTFFNLAILDPDVNLLLDNKNGEPYNLLVDGFDFRKTNTLYNFYKMNNSGKRNRFMGSYVINADIIEGLDAEYKYAIETTNFKYRSHQPFSYLRWDNSKKEFENSKGSLYDYQSKTLAQNSQVSLNYKNSVGDLNFRGKLSFIYESVKFDESDISGSEFAFDGPVTFNNVLSSNLRSSSFSSERNATSYLGIVGADYKDRYIADFLLRRDGSSLFGENNRYANYYRASVAYRISKDLEIDFIDELKIHAAIGTAGQRPSDFRAQYATNRINNGTTNPSQSTLGNPDLRPSKSTEIEFGLTAEFLKRYNFTFAYSNTKTDDQILRVPQAVIKTPIPFKWVNAGELNANAYEAVFGAKIFKDTEFKWNFNANFSKYTNKITRLDVAPYQTGPNSQDGDQIFYVTEGESFGAMYGKVFVRDLETMKKQLPVGETIQDYVVNSDGYVIKSGTEGKTNELAIVKKNKGLNAFEKIGDATPDFKVGIVNNFSYKGWGLYALIDWKSGGDVYNRTQQWLTRDDRSKLLDQAGKPENAKKAFSYYKSFYDQNSVNAYWVEDSSYVKLREVALSYELPKSFLGELIKNVKISIVGRNLLTITDYSGYDPEVATFGSGNGQSQFYSVDFGNYPQTKSYSLSVNLNF